MRKHAAAAAWSKIWFFLPGATLIGLGLSLVLFPGALAWVAAAFLVCSGIALIQAVRFIRGMTESLRTHLGELVLEEGADENPPGPIARQGGPISWVN